jgi:gas vesicle protein
MAKTAIASIRSLLRLAETLPSIKKKKIMRTKIQAIKQKHEDSIKDLQKILGLSHSQDDFSGFVKGIGGEVEKFLKEGVYNNTLNNRNFYQLINELSNHRITQASIDFFHDLRNLYNSLKHDPNFTTYILNCINVLKNSLKSLNEIELQNIGNIHGIYSQQKSRIVWIAGWDDYIGGMTEMGIFLPDYELDFPVGM